MIRQLKLQTPRVRELHDLRRLRGNWRYRLKAVLGGFDFAAEAVPSCEQQNGTVFRRIPLVEKEFP